MDVHALELATQAMEPNGPEALFYRLTPLYRYHGYKDMTFALASVYRRRVFQVRGLRKAVLDLAQGKVNFNLPFLPEDLRREAEAMEQKGILERCAYGAPAQTFHTSDNRYFNMAQWAVTGRCNLRCKHCFVSAPHAKFGELPLEDCKRIIREMAECGIFCVALTGGEPLVRADFFEIIDELCRNNIYVSTIASNGVLINDRVLDQLEERGMKPAFFMSFDGSGWHDWLRGMEGAEKLLMDRFELLARRGFITGSAMTLHQRNKGVLRQSVNQLAGVGVQVMIINKMMDLGEWNQFGEKLGLTHRELFETYLDYLPHFYEDGMPLRLYLNRLIRLEPHSYDYQLTVFHPLSNPCTTAVCPANWHTCYINGDGKLAPCISIAGMEGQAKNFADLTKMSLREGLENSAYSRCIGATVADFFAHNPECDRCRYKRYCQGGCRAFAMEEDDSDYLAIDRSKCEYFREHFTDRILRRLAETVPQAHCTNLPADFPLAEAL